MTQKVKTTPRQQLLARRERALLKWRVPKSVTLPLPKSYGQADFRKWMREELMWKRGINFNPDTPGEDFDALSKASQRRYDEVFGKAWEVLGEERMFRWALAELRAFTSWSMGEQPRYSLRDR